MRKLTVFSVLVFAATALAFRSAPPTLDTEIQGAWHAAQVTNAEGETNQITSHNITMFTEGHYASIRVGGEGERGLLPEEPTDEQRLEAWSRFFASAGTYEVAGDELRTKVSVAKSPNAMAEASVNSSKVAIDGDVLVRTFTNSENGNTFVVTYKRLPGS